MPISSKRDIEDLLKTVRAGETVRNLGVDVPRLETEIASLQKALEAIEKRGPAAIAAAGKAYKDDRKELQGLIAELERMPAVFASAEKSASLLHREFHIFKSFQPDILAFIQHHKVGIANVTALGLVIRGTAQKVQEYARETAEYTNHLTRMTQQTALSTQGQEAQIRRLEELRSSLQLTRREFAELGDTAREALTRGIDTDQLRDVTRSLQDLRGHAQGLELGKQVGAQLNRADIAVARGGTIHEIQQQARLLAPDEQRTFMELARALQSPGATGRAQTVMEAEAAVHRIFDDMRDTVGGMAVEIVTWVAQISGVVRESAGDQGLEQETAFTRFRDFWGGLFSNINPSSLAAASAGSAAVASGQVQTPGGPARPPQAATRAQRTFLPAYDVSSAELAKANARLQSNITQAAVGGPQELGRLAESRQKVAIGGGDVAAVGQIARERAAGLEAEIELSKKAAAQTREQHEAQLKYINAIEQTRMGEIAEEEKTIGKQRADYLRKVAKDTAADLRELVDAGIAFVDRSLQEITVNRRLEMFAEGIKAIGTTIAESAPFLAAGAGAAAAGQRLALVQAMGATPETTRRLGEARARGFQSQYEQARQGLPQKEEDIGKRLEDTLAKPEIKGNTAAERNARELANLEITQARTRVDELRTQVIQAQIKAIEESIGAERRRLDVQQTAAETQKDLAATLGLSYQQQFEAQRNLVSIQAAQLDATNREITQIRERISALGAEASAADQQQLQDLLKRQMVEAAGVFKQSIGLQTDFLKQALGAAFGAPKGTAFQPGTTERMLYGEHSLFQGMVVRGTMGRGEQQAGMRQGIAARLMGGLAPPQQAGLPGMAAPGAPVGDAAARAAPPLIGLAQAANQAVPALGAFIQALGGRAPVAGAAGAPAIAAGVPPGAAGVPVRGAAPGAPPIGGPRPVAPAPPVVPPGFGLPAPRGARRGMGVPQPVGPGAGQPGRGRRRAPTPVQGMIRIGDEIDADNPTLAGLEFARQRNNALARPIAADEQQRREAGHVRGQELVAREQQRRESGNARGQELVNWNAQVRAAERAGRQPPAMPPAPAPAPQVARGQPGGLFAASNTAAAAPQVTAPQQPAAINVTVQLQGRLETNDGAFRAKIEPIVRSVAVTKQRGTV